MEMLSFRDPFGTASVAWTLQALAGFVVYAIFSRRRFGRGAPNRVLKAARAGGAAAAAEEAGRHPANRYAQSMAESLHREQAAERSRWQLDDLETFRVEITRRRVALGLVTLLAAAVPVLFGMLAYVSDQIALMDYTMSLSDNEQISREIASGIQEASLRLSHGTRLGAVVFGLGVLAFVTSGELLNGARRLESDHAQLGEGSLVDGVYEQFTKGGPATATITVIALLAALLAVGWLILRYVRLRANTRTASDWARSGDPGTPPPDNPFLSELAPLAWGSPSGWRIPDEILGGANRTGSVTRLDRGGLALILAALAAVAAVGLSSWMSELRVGASLGMDFWDYLDREAGARGLDARGAAESFTRGMISGATSLLVLVPMAIGAVIFVLLALIDGPASRRFRLEWLVATAMERRDPGHADRWSAWRERLEERYAARWSWNALLFPWAWLPAHGFVGLGIVWFVVWFIPGSVIVLLPAAFFLAIRGHRFHLERCRKRGEPLF